MSSDPKGIPGTLELLWMLFMQPVSLNERLKACGLEELSASAWKLWRTKGPAREASRRYVARLAILLLLVIPVLNVGIAGTLLLSGFTVTWLGVGLSVGMAMGLVIFLTRAVGESVVLALTVASAATMGAILTEFEGTIEVPTWFKDFGIFGVGAMLGFMSAALSDGVQKGVMPGKGTVIMSVVAVALFGVIGAALGGMSGSVIGGTAVLLVISRLPIYPLEAFISLIAYVAQRCLATNTLRFTPVLRHELSLLPYPFLASHLLLAAESEPALVRRVLDACAIAPGQRRIGRNVLATLQARELDACARVRRFTLLADPELGTSDNPPLRWLPSLEAADPLHLSFREAARYLAAADSSLSHHRLDHVYRAEAQLQALNNDLLSSRSPLARALRPTLQTWRTIAADMRLEAERVAGGFLPNPFRPGNALGPDQGSDVFRGREEIVHQIKALLADPGQSLSIALLGPRRSGKSSLLKMLPALLPDAVCIFFDLQDHPVDNPAGFFRELARTARDQARRDRRLDLPPLPEGGPFEAGSAWLRALDELAGGRRILLCIDEFERLESLFPGESADLRRLMGLFRATIQHRRRLRLLVSGAAPFDELSGMWNDHFINVLELRLELLDEPTSVDLLMHPIPQFPEDAIPELVARAVFARTGGQPLLLQAFGDALVSRLNEQQPEPRRANLADVDAVQEHILQRYRPFFADTMNREKMSRAARAALLALAHGRAPELDTRTRRWLRQRCLLTADDRLRIPVLGAWIRDEGLELDQ
jgi:hypothetical protein